jgi:hypothetical protein
LCLDRIKFAAPPAVVAVFPGPIPLAEDDCDSERDSQRFVKVGEVGGRDDSMAAAVDILNLVRDREDDGE